MLRIPSNWNKFLKLILKENLRKWMKKLLQNYLLELIIKEFQLINYLKNGNYILRTIHKLRSWWVGRLFSRSYYLLRVHIILIFNRVLFNAMCVGLGSPTCNVVITGGDRSPYRLRSLWTVPYTEINHKETMSFCHSLDLSLPLAKMFLYLNKQYRRW